MTLNFAVGLDASTYHVSLVVLELAVIRMNASERVQETLYDEMLGRIKQTDLSVPYRDGPYFYYSRLS